MVIREITADDYKIINYLNQLQDFKLQHIGNCIIDRIVTKDNTPIAYGIVKRMGEAIILVNPETPAILRSKALMELMKYAELGSVRAGCEQLQCFVSDESLAGILEKHFGFVRSKDIVLCKNL